MINQQKMTRMPELSLDNKQAITFSADSKSMCICKAAHFKGQSCITVTWLTLPEVLRFVVKGCGVSEHTAVTIL